MHESTRMAIKTHAVAVGVGLVVGGVAALLIAVRLGRTEIRG